MNKLTNLIQEGNKSTFLNLCKFQFRRINILINFNNQGTKMIEWDKLRLDQMPTT